ncbi:hypothetical protein FRC14_005785 [Serendipita sp. 396]|nr:hypothetical protein FRC14_005785 [Serendipita sp. 396]KAG8787104.1 hypothetical protein FRC15_009946 [Serendipita sp. 397]KAG8872285.1 hypothetical protein FRC20_009587 [Serendipita sp. 405]
MNTSSTILKIASTNSRPFGLQFRSSAVYVTAIVFIAVFVDLLVYSIIIPVIPFRLQQLGYSNPSALTGWLLFAYSLGLVCATPPLAFLAERYCSRRNPMTVSLFALIGSQILFMEAKWFWLMFLARVVQGISSAAVWVVAFALLCDTVLENKFGQYLGIAMTGVRLGYLAGPPLGGLLNEKVGYRAPFILGLIFCAFDLLGRWFVIEKHEAMVWMEKVQSGSSSHLVPSMDQETRVSDAPLRQRSKLSVFTVIATLARSKRATAALLNIFINGIIFTIMEPTLPFRLQDVYLFTPYKVGIVYLIFSSPALITIPIVGYISDKFGVEWVTLVCLIASIPWWVAMSIRGPLPLLVACLAFSDILLAAVSTPLTADLAAVARDMGIGYAHVFGAYNFFYSVAGAVGPIIGGQIYSHVKSGWIVITGSVAGLLFAGAIVAMVGAGEKPIILRIKPLDPIIEQKQHMVTLSSGMYDSKTPVLPRLPELAIHSPLRLEPYQYFGPRVSRRLDLNSAGVSYDLAFWSHSELTPAKGRIRQTAGGPLII